jgi:hypothetical protein
MTACLPEKDNVTRGWHKHSRKDKPSYQILARLIFVLLHRISYIVPASGLFPPLPGEQVFHSLLCCCVPSEVTGFRNTRGSQGNFYGVFLSCG